MAVRMLAFKDLKHAQIAFIYPPLPLWKNHISRILFSGIAKPMACYKT